MPAPSPLPHFSETTSIVSVGVREYDALAVAKNTSMFLDEKTKKKHDGILVTDPRYVFFDFLHVRAAGRRKRNDKVAASTDTPSFQSVVSAQAFAERASRIAWKVGSRTRGPESQVRCPRGSMRGPAVRHPSRPKRECRTQFQSVGQNRSSHALYAGRPPPANARRAFDARFFSAHSPSPSHSRFSLRSTRRRQGREGPRHPRAVYRVDPPIFLVQLGEGVRRHGAGL
jgi:hypothetical protein